MLGVPRFLAPLFVSVFLAATMASAEKSRKEHPIIRGWLKDLKAIEEQLLEIGQLTDEQAKTKRAKRQYNRVTRLQQEVIDRTISFSRLDAVLGVTTALRAVSSVMCGEVEEGEWHWHVAGQLFPEVQEVPLDRFGTSGRYLDELRQASRSQPESADENEEELPRTEPHVVGGNVLKPKKVHAPRPQWPRAKLRESGSELKIIVQAIIDEFGRVRKPTTLLSPGDSTYSLAVFNALRNWRFEPAVLDDKPVAVYFNLTINFKKETRPQPGGLIN